MYEDVSLLASSFAIAHSKWNGKFGSAASVLRVKETLDGETKLSEAHEV